MDFGQYRNLNTTGKELTITKQSDGTYTFSFADGENTRYLALNKTANNDFFAYYTGTNQIYKLTLVKKGTPVTTDIEDIEQPTKNLHATKVFENGQIYIILPDGRKYNMQGVEVK